MSSLGLWWEFLDRVNIVFWIACHAFKVVWSLRSRRTPRAWSCDWTLLRRRVLNDEIEVLVKWQSCNRGSLPVESYKRNEFQVSFKVDPVPPDYQTTISQHNQFLMDGMFIILGTKTPIQKFIITFKTFSTKMRIVPIFFISGSLI